MAGRPDYRGHAEQMKIKGVQRMARFEHDVIGDIDDVVDRAQAGLFQSGTQPRRAGADLDAAQDARRVTRAKFRFLDAHGQQLFRRLAGQVRGGDLDFGQAQRVARQRADFARDADDAVPIGPIGRDFQIINHVARRPSEVFRERLADDGVRRARSGGPRCCPAGPVPAGEQSMPWDSTAANFAGFDRDGLLRPVWPGSVWPGRIKGTLSPALKFCAPQTICRSPRPSLTRQRESLSALGCLSRVRTWATTMPSNSPPSFCIALDLQAEQGQAFGQFLGRPVQIDVLLEPVKSDLHLVRNDRGALRAAGISDLEPEFQAN